MGSVLTDVSAKVDVYNHMKKADKYNRAYRDILNARRGHISLIGEDGSFSEESLGTIEDALTAFDMARFGKMNDKFREKLRNKLSESGLRDLLKKISDLRIETYEWQNLENEMEKLYDELSAEGTAGLSSDGTRFDVGASKILNFLFPELCVMVDKNVMKTLVGLGLVKTQRKGSTYDYSFGSYWRTMQICRQELLDYIHLHGDLYSLLQYDRKPTTYTRIFDKCAFVLATNTSRL